MARHLLAALALSLLLVREASSQGNHVVLRDFDWKVSSTEHFDIYHYEDSKALVPFAASVLERSYARMSRQLGVKFDKRKPFFLYANVNDMQQSNIVQIGDGTGGVTEAFKDRFMVFNDGSRQWLDTVITHELVHVFQFHVLVSGFWRSARILKTIIYPLWMMEGMAEWGSWGLDDTAGQLVVRDAATSGMLIPVWKLERFSHLKPHQVRLAYESGQEILEFLETQYGPGRVESLLKMFESRFETSAVLQDLIGTDVFGFDKKWREHVEEKYRRVVRRERLVEPEAYGKALTGPSGNLPQYNTAPVFSPDGSAMAFLSTRDAHPPSVIVKDLRTGKLRRLFSGETPIETVHLGNFANISRMLAMSPDGRRVAFAGTKNHRDSIYLADVASGRIERVPVPGMMTVRGPAFSPDGRSLAFSGMREGFTDIYVIDLETRAVRRVTDDRADDQTPDFSPDGRSIVYSSEVERPGEPMLYQRRIQRVDLATLAVEPLVSLHGAARDPVHSPDGERLLFALEEAGHYDVYELDLATRRVARLTRSIGAAYTPAYAPGGEIAFSALRRGSIHVHRGPRERFLDEEVAAGVPSLRPGARLVEPSTSPALSQARPYQGRYSTDLFIPAFFYSSNGGFFWTSYYQGSDMLGNHGVQALVSYASGQGFLNYQTAYSYNRFRPQLSVAASGITIRDNFDSSNGISYDESVHSQYVGVSYPLDRYHRLDFTAGSATETRDAVDADEVINREARIATAAFVRDTVRGRYLVANRGSRLTAGYLVAPRLLGGNFVYQTFALQGVKYFPLGDLSSFVLRGLGLHSEGRTTPRYLLGGLGGVRGYGRNNVADEGSRVAVATAEWRFPILSNLDYYMWYIFPNFYFKAVTGAFFTDAGYVWETKSDLSLARWTDLRHSYGGGLRIHTFILQLFPLVIHFDYARRTTTGGGIFYVYLGPLF